MRTYLCILRFAFHIFYLQPKIVKKKQPCVIPTSVICTGQWNNNLLTIPLRDAMLIREICSLPELYRDRYVTCTWKITLRCCRIMLYYFLYCAFWSFNNVIPVMVKLQHYNCTQNRTNIIKTFKLFFLFHRTCIMSHELNHDFMQELNFSIKASFYLTS